jgi:hypothetical protein
VSEYILTTNNDIFELFAKREEARRKADKDATGLLGKSFLYKLPYFDLRFHIGIEYKHAEKDIIMDVTFKKMWKGIDLRSPKIDKYYESLSEYIGIRILPLIFDYEVPKCSFLPDEMKLCEATLRCLLIPINCTSKLVFSEFKIFDLTAFISIDNIFTVFTTYIDLLLMCSDWIHDVFNALELSQQVAYFFPAFFLGALLVLTVVINPGGIASNLHHHKK